MLPSLANRPPPARREPVALIGSENIAPAPPASSLAGAIARLKAWRADGGDSRLAQLIAGKVFLVRVGSALLALASQVLLARWMGGLELGFSFLCWAWGLL